MDQSEVKALIAAEAPRWADLPVRPIRSSGTDSSCGAATAYSLGREPQENETNTRLAAERRQTAIRARLHLLSPLRGFDAYGREYLGLPPQAICCRCSAAIDSRNFNSYTD